ncbi:MAG: hypothetical protein EBS84_20205 [Proteobacteria bacterium]|nr:hypothetical protein [Verrucomicrobiota bacterium]NBU11304.1 hypothetical protein [Pseudomonadota bacterium]
MTFFANGTVGLGAARCEQFWQLTNHESDLALELISRDGSVTCQLAHKGENVWHGRWSMYERMPVELRNLCPIPAAPRKVGCSNPELSITAVMTSCPERREVRERTLQNLRETDWGNRIVHVQIDQSSSSDRIGRIVDIGFQALSVGLQSGSDYILYLEDDLAFNQSFWHNLNCWTPLRSKRSILASLFNPGFATLSENKSEAWAAAKATDAICSQALILGAPTARHILSQWDTMANPVDHRIYKLGAQLDEQIYLHTPSLVHHLGVNSLWGGVFFQARDFHPFWRAPRLAAARATPIKDEHH